MAEARPESAAVLVPFDRDVLLSTGRAVRIRPSSSNDLDALHRFYDELSDRSTYLRFFGTRPHRDDAELHPPGGQDVDDHVVLLALDAGQIVGVGEYRRVLDLPEVDVAFAVADSHQHQGIGTVLLEDLAMIARAAGFQRLVAETLAANAAMMLVFRTVGLVHRSWYEQGQIHVELDLAGDELLQDESDGRDWTAAVASLGPLLAPSHVVVIGAGRNPTSPGRVILANLVASFQGRVSVVHPSEAEIGGCRAVAAVGELDGAPDLAVIAVPAAGVLGVIEECGRAGIAAAVVISAGFAEGADDDGVAALDGVERERLLIDTARRYGMRIVGPNCLGVVSSAASLNATFMRQALAPGSIAIASQSGGIGIVLATEAAQRHLGVSAFVSLGNKVDVSGNDVLRYWADDPATAVALMYMESIGDPRRFARIARSVSKRLPIVALKSGRSEAGQRGARSHTAALATDEASVEALFAHTGVLRANTLDQLLDIGALLAAQPAPKGRRVALVGNAGGPLILAADAASANGLQVVELSEPLQARIRAIVPDAAATSNPVDLLATATTDASLAVIAEIAASGEIDACALVVVSLDGEQPSGPPQRFEWEHATVPGVAVLLGGLTATGSMPQFPTPERAMDALGRAAERGEWLSFVAEERVSVEGVDLLDLRHRARLVTPADGSPRWVPPTETFGLLEAAGIPIAPWAIGRGAAECAEHAERIGFPCALKADVEGVLHKVDAGAVVLGVASAAEVEEVVTDFERRFGAGLRHVFVQRMADPGVEMLIGAVRDPSVGPLVVVGSGGTQAELIGDRAVLLAPVSEQRARWAIQRLRMYPLLTGFRGAPVVPISPLVEIIRRIGLLVAAVPEISELDLNPAIAGPDGCVVVDARIAVAHQPQQPLRALRVPRR